MTDLEDDYIMRDTGMYNFYCPSVGFEKPLLLDFTQ